MKGALAIMLELFSNFHKKYPDASLGIAVTSDEEKGGTSGIGYLFDEVGLKCDLAINPDGVVQLCFPEGAGNEVQQKPIQQFAYPKDENKGFPFTDGAGQQAFFVVESSKPLPSFQEWRATGGDLVQPISKTTGRWIWRS